MQTVLLPSFSLTGIQLPGKTTNEGGQSAIDCGNLWKEFMSKDVAHSIPNKEGEEVFAVYFDYEGDHTKPFCYFIGCKVRDTVPVKGLSTLVIPAQKYALQVAKGKMPDCIANTWRDIWRSGTKRNYGFDFEVYGEKGRDPNNAEIDVYISIR